MRTSTATQTPYPAAVLCADWGKDIRTRSLYVEFLTRAHSSPNFFDGTSIAADWKVERPFFSVPAGEGGLSSYRNAAAEQGVNLYREIDRATRAKTMFAKSGIPGSVGSAACALWQELGPRLATSSRIFTVWPFEGELQALLESSPVVVGEIYPRAAYATALLDPPTVLRSPLALAKTDPDIRRDAIAALQTAVDRRDYGAATILPGVVDARTHLVAPGDGPLGDDMQKEASVRTALAPLVSPDRPFVRNVAPGGRAV